MFEVFGPIAETVTLVRQCLSNCAKWKINTGLGATGTDSLEYPTAIELIRACEHHMWNHNEFWYKILILQPSHVIDIESFAKRSLMYMKIYKLINNLIVSQIFNLDYLICIIMKHFNN